MADTSQAEQASGQPQTNGFADDGLDDEERGKMRPADIDADVREMERRKRVEMIMNSRLFREELERIIESQMKEGGSGPGGLLQQLTDMMGPGVGRLQSTNMFRSPNCVVPINDIRGVESMGYAKGEKLLRCKLAAVYRLIDLYGWTQGIHNHITARLNQDEEQFLVNPWGMLYHEVTASSLVKVDMQGNTVEAGTTNFGVNREGFKLHAAIHSARPDIKCIIHTHTSSVVAVSSLKTGLLPLCHEALVIGEVSTHPYIGGIYDPEEQEKIARNLGPINKVLFLTNHGAVCCGETVEEAFFNVYNTVQACDTQVKLMPLGIDNLVLLPDESRKRVYDAARRPPEGHVLDKDKEVTSPTVADRKEKRWRVGGTEFEALMRMLDNAGFRTGYIYRNPLVKGDPPRPRNDIEVPPAVSSLGYLLEEEELYKQGGWKKFGKSHDRTRWLNSPNVYQKVEILETGTPDPKKITKWVDANADEWVADGSPTHSSTPVKINTLQFVPKNTNPKEFKKLQQQIKENRRADKITSGPQSQILEGVSWEEAKKMQDANISQTGDQVILVGAASKGIIQRGFQHNATVYKAPYAKNPFDTVTEEELEEYKRAVDRKARGEHYDDSESEALSSSAAARPPTGKSLQSPTSETEEESRDEHRVLRIETKQAPRPIQAEVVLSDDSDYPDAIMERSKSARFPTKATPDLVTVPSSIGRSWSLGRNKRSNRANSQASSLPGLHNAPRHFHHARYVTLPVCEGPARPASPCSITRYSSVLEPSSRIIPFQYPYPSYPTLSISSLRSSAPSIPSSVDSDSIADDVSIPCGGSARSQSRTEMFSETVRARVMELPRVDRVVVAKPFDSAKECDLARTVLASQLDKPMNIQLELEGGSATTGRQIDNSLSHCDFAKNRVRREKNDCQLEDCDAAVTCCEKTSTISQERTKEIVTSEDESVEAGFKEATFVSRLVTAESDLCFPVAEFSKNEPGQQAVPEQPVLRKEVFEEQVVLTEEWVSEYEGHAGGDVSGRFTGEELQEDITVDVQDDTVIAAPIDGSRVLKEQGSGSGTWEEEIAEERVFEGISRKVGQGDIFAVFADEEQTSDEVVEEEHACEYLKEDQTVEEVAKGEHVYEEVAKEERVYEKVAEECVYEAIAEEEYVYEAVAEEERVYEAVAKEEHVCDEVAKEERVCEEVANEALVSKDEKFAKELTFDEVVVLEELLHMHELLECGKKLENTDEHENFGKIEEKDADLAVETEFCGDAAKEMKAPEYFEEEEARNSAFEKEDLEECKEIQEVQKKCKEIENDGECENDEERAEECHDTGNEKQEGGDQTTVGDKSEAADDGGGEEKSDVKTEANDVAESKAMTAAGDESLITAAHDEKDSGPTIADVEESEAADNDEEAATDDNEECQAAAYKEINTEAATDDEKENQAAADVDEEENKCGADNEEVSEAAVDDQEGSKDAVDNEEASEAAAADEEEGNEAAAAAEEEGSEAAAADEEEGSEAAADDEEEGSEAAADDEEEGSKAAADDEEEGSKAAADDEEEGSKAAADDEEEGNEAAANDEEEGSDADVYNEKGTESTVDDKEECEAADSAGEECEAPDSVGEEYEAADEEYFEDSAKDQIEDTTEENGDSTLKEEVNLVPTLPVELEQSAAPAAEEYFDNPASIASKKEVVASIFTDKSEDVSLLPKEVGIDLQKNSGIMEGACANSSRRVRDALATINEAYSNASSNEQKLYKKGSGQVFPSEEVDAFNDLTFICESLDLIEEASDKNECYQHFNDLIMEAVAAACNASVDDRYDEAYPPTDGEGLYDETNFRPPNETNLQWDFSDMTLWEEDSDDSASFHGDVLSETLSSTKSFHFGEETPKVAAAFWDPGSLPTLHDDFPTANADDTVSVKSWVQQETGKQQTEADESNSSAEVDDLEWSGAFTESNTYDERSWERRERRRARSCGFEGGKEALFDLQDAPLSDQFYSPFSSPDGPFYSPVSPSYFNNPQGQVERTPSHTSRRRSSSVGDLVPVNTFHFSVKSSKDLPKVSVTQTVSLTGSLTNKRVDVQTTVVSDRDGGKCVTTKVSCSPAGDVRGRLYDNHAKSSPLELGRVFTLKNRRNLDS